MDTGVRRTRHDRGRRGDETSLAQTFEFPDGITASAISDVLRSAPLVGADSVFGERPGDEHGRDGPHDSPTRSSSTPSSRRLSGFSPAPGFTFDVDLAEREPDVFVVSFSQPDRATPYLAGDAVWIVADGPASARACLDEEINTERAGSFGADPLTGSRPSLRRWLFFRIGHAQVMRDATTRIASLAAA